MCITSTALSYSLRIRIDQKLEGAAKTRTHAYECEQQLNNLLYTDILVLYQVYTVCTSTTHSHVATVLYVVPEVVSTNI